MTRRVFVGLIFSLAAPLHEPAATRAADVAAQSSPPVLAPRFEVDPFWPKPLPNHWVLGSTVGLSVDARDHVFVIHRPQTVEDNFKAADLVPQVGACCSVAPPVLEFDQAGTLVGHWGGPGAGYEWPESNHGITVDQDGNVWIGGNGMSDTQLLKFTRTGQFLLQLGKHGVHGGSNDRDNFWKDGSFVKEAFFEKETLRSGSVWDIAFSRDPEQTYLYIANGVNQKISIVRRSTLEVLTSFGDGGRQPGQFFGVHNLDTDSSGNLYATETYTGARVQRFLYRGVGPVTKAEQGVPWPERAGAATHP